MSITAIGTKSTTSTTTSERRIDAEVSRFFDVLASAGSTIASQERLAAEESQYTEDAGSTIASQERLDAEVSQYTEEKTKILNEGSGTLLIDRFFDRAV
jgi:hypothetical protein